MSRDPRVDRIVARITDDLRVRQQLEAAFSDANVRVTETTYKRRSIMNPKARLVARTISIVILAFIGAWAVADYSFDKAALAAATLAAFQAAVELLGPTSDAGVKWEQG